MEIIAEKGADVFYHGSIGQDLIKDIKDAGWCALTVGHVCTVGYFNSQKMSWDVAGGAGKKNNNENCFLPDSSRWDYGYGRSKELRGPGDGRLEDSAGRG